MLVSVARNDEPPKIERCLRALVPPGFGDCVMALPPSVGSADDVLPTLDAKFVLDRAVCHVLPDAGPSTS